MISDTKQLLDGLEADRSDAQTQLFEEYFHALTGIVRGNVRNRLARRVDASDIALSALRTFFLHMRDGGAKLEQREQIWKLLVTITLNKLRNHVRRHEAAKRSVRREIDAADASQLRHRFEPGPEDIAALNDELEWVLDNLKPYHREIGERILAGQTVPQISEETTRSPRTVRRVESAIENHLVARLRDTPLAREP